MNWSAFASPNTTRNAVNAKTHGFPPSTWGAQLWFSLHIMTAALPPRPSRAEQQHYFSYFKALQYVLPCGGCREEYTSLLRGNGGFPAMTLDTFSSRSKAFSWLVAIHDAVNARLGKPAYMRPWREWYAYYDSFR
jgi:hypothetical protein